MQQNSRYRTLTELIDAAYRVGVSADFLVGAMTLAASTSEPQDFDSMMVTVSRQIELCADGDPNAVSAA